MTHKGEEGGNTIEAATTTEELRAEVERLKRQLEEQRRGSQDPLKHPAKPSGAKIALLLILLVAVLVAAFIAGYLPHQRRQLQLTAEANAEQQALPEVSVASVRHGDIMGQLVLPGNIQPVTEAPILARAEGYIKKRYVD